MNPWHAAGSLVVHKMLGELSYERLFAPVPAAGGGWSLPLPGGVEYRFAARRGAFESWWVEPGSALRVADGVAGPATDPRTLVLDARDVLGLGGGRLADVLSELTATVAAEARRLADAPDAAALAAVDYDRAEALLTGHPRLVLNKGRVGFSAADRRAYAPEARRPLRLRWYAVHRDLAAFRCVPGLSEAALREAELGAAVRAEFEARLDRPAEYVWLPVHPWQAEEIVGTLYAAELATGRIVELGPSPDEYVPHQTVRTLANVGHPARFDVKTAVSVRNTLVYRGLAAAATLAAPQVTTWLRAVHAADPLLRDEYRFGLLGEVAAVSVRHPLFGAVPDLPYRFHETLGALWREPMRATLAPGERALSFAALPYRGPDGPSVLAHLIGTSGLSAEDWLARAFDLLLTPLLHWLVRYGVAYCPHGQNLVLVTDPAGRPLRVSIKDFAQGVDLLDRDVPEYAALGAEADAHMLRWPGTLLVQSVFSSILAGQFRFWAEVLLDDSGLPRPRFWELVRAVVGRYRERFGLPASAYQEFDLLAPTVERVCLNREHLAGEGFDRVDRDEEFDVRFGRVPNPLVAPDPDGAW
ncbi:MAG TPA: IucA/IucC family protein [Pseudonocardiaceae bacterium]